MSYDEGSPSSHDGHRIRIKVEPDDVSTSQHGQGYIPTYEYSTSSQGCSVGRARGVQRSASMSMTMGSHEVHDREYELAELKNVESVQHDGREDLVEDTGEGDHLIEEADVGVDMLHCDEQVGPEEENYDDDETLYILRLIDCVKQYPALYDPNDQNYGKKRASIEYRRQIWNTIRHQLDWTGPAPIEGLWIDLVQRYARKRRSELLMTTGAEMDDDDYISNTVANEMLFLDQYTIQTGRQNQKVLASNQLLRAAEKDLYGESNQQSSIPQDVMISGCRPVVAHALSRMSETESVSHSGAGYVVVQPTSHVQRQRQQQQQEGSQQSRSMIQPSQQQHDDASTSQAHSQIVTPRGYQVPQQLQSQPQVRRMVVQSHTTQQEGTQTQQGFVNHKIVSIAGTVPQRVIQLNDGTSQMLEMVKKNESDSIGQGGSGTMTMMVDTTTYYQNGNGQKMYRLFTMPQSSQQHHTHSQHQQQSSSSTATMGTTSGAHQPIQRSSMDYDMGPPEPLIESSPTSSAPPRKKMAIARQSSHLQHSQQVAGMMQQTMGHPSMQSNNRVDDNTIVAGGVPIADDEIIDDGIQQTTMVIDPDGHLHEESPLLSESPDMASVMISGQSARPAPPPQQAQQRMTSTQQGIHHQHHIARRGRTPPEDVEQVVVDNAQEQLLHHQSQYDADLQFQQLISAHLSRLNDDDKALMKYNMQRILLDARFGVGTANRLLQEEEAELASGQVDGELTEEVEEGVVGEIS